MPKRTDHEAETKETETDHDAYERGGSSGKASNRGGDYGWAQDIIEDVLENTKSDVLRRKIKQ